MVMENDHMNILKSRIIKQSFHINYAYDSKLALQIWKNHSQQTREAAATFVANRLISQAFFSQVTKNIHNLLQAAQKGKIENYLSCAENILTAVKEIVTLFPEVLVYFI